MKQKYEEPFQVLPLKSFQIDCMNCVGFCCVALYFSKIDGFPNDKPAGTPCKKLNRDHMCTIHSKLATLELHGCLRYDCFGAGQKISEHIDKSIDWNMLNHRKKSMYFEAFFKLFHLQQTLWYLTLSTSLSITKPKQAEIMALLAEGDHLANVSLQELAVLDIIPFTIKCNAVLKQLTQQLSNNRIEQCIGKDLSNRELSSYDFSMTCMIGANLSKTTLSGSNFLGADTRDVNIADSDLSTSIFLTQMQLNAMHGNTSTKIPYYLQRPTSWK